MKGKQTILKWSIAIIIGMLLGGEISRILTWNDKIAISSNRSALEEDLIQGIEDYHKANGRYPDSLEPIKISWLAGDDDRRKLLLKPFYYENRGSTYVLWWPRTEL